MDEPLAIEVGAIPDDLKAWVKPELAPGERLLWAARAISRPTNTAEWLTKISLFLVGFLGSSGLFLAGCFGWLGNSIAAYSALLGLLGVITGLIGFAILLGMLGGWSIRRSQRRLIEGNVYALTDRRAILWKRRVGIDAIEVHSFACGKIARVSRLEYPDGSGDVFFAFPRDEEGFYFGERGFLGVAEVRRIEEMVRKTLIDAESNTSQ